MCAAVLAEGGEVLLQIVQRRRFGGTDGFLGADNGAGGIEQVGLLVDGELPECGDPLAELLLGEWLGLS